MTQSEKEPPKILSEEDVPLNEPPVGLSLTDKSSDDLSKVKDTPGSLDIRKFSLGSTTLGWCIFLMFVCVVAAIWKPDNELVKNGFEAFRIIIMTILGYIFGSSAKS